MDFDVNIINPFLLSAVNTCKMVSGFDLTIGKPYLRGLDFAPTEVLIMIGVTGAMTGQVIMCFPEENAKAIASAMMMGMPVETLDDMAISAISELGNMTMGNAATGHSEKGIIIDITPPIVQRGMVHLGVQSPVNICVPLMKDGAPFMSMNILVKRKEG